MYTAEEHREIQRNNRRGTARQIPQQLDDDNEEDQETTRRDMSAILGDRILKGRATSYYTIEQLSEKYEIPDLPLALSKYLYKE